MRTHWSLVEDGRADRVVESTIGKIWSIFGLEVGLVDHFKPLNPPALFIDKLDDVVGLYRRPKRRARCAWTRVAGSRPSSVPAGVPDYAGTPETNRRPRSSWARHHLVAVMNIVDGTATSVHRRDRAVGVEEVLV